MPCFEETFGKLSPSLRGFTVSLIMLCGAVPSFFAGQLADKYGRLSIVSLGALTFVVGAVLQGAAFQLSQLLVGRAFCGLGEGLWISCISVYGFDSKSLHKYRLLIRHSYITEIAPSTRRGMLVSMPQLMCCAGICAGYFTCYATVHIESSLSWRAPYIVQAGLGTVLATCRFVLPDSPRWLLLHGQRDKAIQELKRLDFSAVEAEKDLLGPAAEQQMLARPGPVEGLVMIFRKQYRSRTVLALFTLGMVQLSGIDGVLYCKQSRPQSTAATNLGPQMRPLSSLKPAFRQQQLPSSPPVSPRFSCSQ